jgi:hypothetical protein
MLTVNEAGQRHHRGRLAPVDALGQITHFDLGFDADVHMVMVYVRSDRAASAHQGLFAPPAG